MTQNQCSKVKELFHKRRSTQKNQSNASSFISSVNVDMVSASITGVTNTSKKNESQMSSLIDSSTGNNADIDKCRAESNSVGEFINKHRRETSNYDGFL